MVMTVTAAVAASGEVDGEEAGLPGEDGSWNAWDIGC